MIWQDEGAKLEGAAESHVEPRKNLDADEQMQIRHRLHFHQATYDPTAYTARKPRIQGFIVWELENRLQPEKMFFSFAIAVTADLHTAISALPGLVGDVLSHTPLVASKSLHHPILGRLQVG